LAGESGEEIALLELEGGKRSKMAESLGMRETENGGVLLFLLEGGGGMKHGRIYCSSVMLLAGERSGEDALLE
jgi:hypothetical protein